jgi:hypothetical protein
MVQVTLLLLLLHLYRMGSTERLRYVHDVISSLTIAEVTPKVPVADMVQQHGAHHLRVGGASFPPNRRIGRVCRTAW